jgi:hypothetical protein
MTDTAAQIEAVNDARAQIKACAEAVLSLKAERRPGESVPGEAIANIVLAYRHLEDASMRLGKAIQALDGGVSVYDKRTTVGA